ncbi:MAG: hypothetical protein ABDI19_02475 [Armatimonadota bacterium]
MRRWALLLAVVAGLTGSFMPFPFGQARRESHPGCFCRDCAGGEACCCVRADTGVAKAVALSRCDRAEQQVASLVSMPRWLAQEPLLIPAPTFAFISYHPFIISPLSRSVAPRDPPPRTL